MPRFGSFNLSGMKELQKNLQKLKDTDKFAEACAKELAARLLAMVIKRTPVGEYSKEIEVTAKRDGKKHKKGETYKKRVTPSGKKGGTLRRGWTDGKQQDATAYVNSLTVNHFGNTYVIELVNPVEYAPYVEYGHRTADHKGWVQGKFMMTISENELKQIAPKVLEAKLKKYLGSAFT